MIHAWLCRFVVILTVLFGSVLPALAAEQISSFHSDITVYPDASSTVVETIRVQSEGRQIKRGIYRDFPVVYQNKFGVRSSVDFELLEVLRDGQSEPWHQERQGGFERIYIGDINTSLSAGVYTYTLTYKVKRHLGFYKDFDELYWNVTGNQWAFPIQQASVRIHLPPGAEVLQAAAYAGEEGSARQAADIVEEADGISITARHTLAPREGLTVAVGWSKGVVVEPAPRAWWLQFYEDNQRHITALLAILLVVAYYVWAWRQVGRDPKPGTIVPLFEPPEGISPVSAYYLMWLGVATDEESTLTILLLSLAAKKLIHIYPTGKKEYEIEKNPDAVNISLAEPETIGMEQLFKKQGRLALNKSNSLKLIKVYQVIRVSVQKALHKSYMVTNQRYYTMGLILSVLPVILILFDSQGKLNELLLLAGALIFFAIIRHGPLEKKAPGTPGEDAADLAAERKFLQKYALPIKIGIFIFIIFCGVQKASPSLIDMGFLIGLFFVQAFSYFLLRAPTLKGRQLMDQLEGFRLFLKTAEQDRLNKLTQAAPSMTPQLFEAYLPWAIALRVENEWALRFEREVSDALRKGYQPSWYTGSGGRPFNSKTFTKSLATGLSTAFATTSHTSGSRGGGFSGGGRGGGGGGGW